MWEFRAITIFKSNYMFGFKKQDGHPTGNEQVFFYQFYFLRLVFQLTLSKKSLVH